MIRQTELRTVSLSMQLLMEAETHPTINAYLKAQSDSKKLMDKLRDRLRQGETVETGPLELQVKRSPVVSWEKFWLNVSSVPAVAKLIATNRQVQRLLSALNGRNPHQADFITERLTVQVAETPADGFADEE